MEDFKRKTPKRKEALDKKTKHLASEAKNVTSTWENTNIRHVYVSIPLLRLSYFLR